MAKSFIIFLLCFITFAANAQAITEDDLLGKWDLTALDVSGNYMDLKTDTATMSVKFLNDNPSMTRDQWEAHFKNMLTAFKGSFILFLPDKRITLSIAGSHQESGYEIIEMEGKAYLDDHSGEGPFPISIKDGLLYWIIEIDESTSAIMILEKVAE
jgi:hypothetical protein